MLFTEVDDWRESQKFWRRCGRRIRNTAAGTILVISVTLLFGARVWVPFQNQTKFAPAVAIELIGLACVAAFTAVKMLTWTLEVHNLLHHDE